MASFEFLAVTVSLLGLAASITYYAIIIGNQNRTRQAQLFTQLYRDHRTPENLRLLGKAMSMSWINYDDFHTKYNNRDKMEERLPYTVWSMYYQEIGVLLKEGLISIELVAQFLPDGFRGYWKKFEPIILETRKMSDYPEYFSGMEYLYNEFCKYRGHSP
jgi:hypothetical protein